MHKDYRPILCMDLPFPPSTSDFFLSSQHGLLLACPKEHALPFSRVNSLLPFASMSDAARSQGLLESGFTWTEFRDCFITFSCHEAHDIPLQFLSIVEFLMTDERGAGTTNLEDAMELLFRRFGVPTDNMFVRLFGNDCDPKMQMPLGHYLEKVALLIQERRELSLAAEEQSQRKQLGGSGGGVRKRPTTGAL